MRLAVRKSGLWLALVSGTGCVMLAGCADGALPERRAAFNVAPVISGTPVISVVSSESYQFVPTAYDADGDALSFSIDNKPDWVVFDTTTGELSGSLVTLSNRHFRDIVISVSDGLISSSLPSFDIEVQARDATANCDSTLTSGEPWSCQLDRTTSDDLRLIDPPRGLSIQPRTGILHWTPSSDQSGQYTVAVAGGGADDAAWRLDLTVAKGESDDGGIYVAVDGDDDASGSASAPLQTIRAAARLAVPGDTIIVRGGVYYNSEYGSDFDDRASGSLARITTSGTAAQPITLRPHGNEYVKLISDVNGLQFKNAQYWIVDGFEIEGTAQSITKDDVLALWWEDGPNKITGRGISTNSSQHITLRNNVIHDFAGAAIANNGSDMLLIENNVLYNSGWWSTGGVHGVSNSYLTTAEGNEGKEALIMQGNLVFGNQSRVISHVFSKGNVDLAIDEGNGLHAQNNSGTFFGKARIENNLLMFNGKAGFGINTMDAVQVLNNSFFQNAQVVDTGELAIQSSAPTAVTGNLFSPLELRKTVKDSSDNYDLMKNNASSYGRDAAEMPAETLYPVVYNDPANLDFSPATDVSVTLGVPEADRLRMMATVAEYGIEVKAPDLDVIDESYLTAMKQVIFTSWPQAYSDLTLTDRASKLEYRYEQRCNYPGVDAAVCN